MKISVALCTYHGEQYVRELLDSIAAQSTPPDEIIISDDNSSDNTLAVIHEFRNTCDIPIKILQSQSTMGVNTNYEFAIRQCAGDIIFIADQDDVWYDEKIEQISALISQNRSSAVFTNAELIDESGSKVQGSLWEKYDFNSEAISASSSILRRLLISNVVTGSTLAISREVLQLVLPFPKSDLFLYDEWIACVLAAHPKHSVVQYDRLMMQYRIHEKQFTARDNPPVTGAFPYNWAAYIRPIVVRQRLFELLSSRLEKLGVDNKEVNECRTLWDLRLANCREFSIKIKLHLFARFVSGHYHRFVRRPFEFWIKDLIAWPRGVSS